MPSASLQQWRTVRAASLDEIEAAHSSLGGVGPGRRYATQQVNHAYVVLLSSQFQGFCRDLHTECVEVLVRTVPLTLQVILEENLKRDRRLDKGNPNPGNIGSDFGRLDISFWQAVYAQDARSTTRRALRKPAQSAPPLAAWDECFHACVKWAVLSPRKNLSRVPSGRAR